MWQTMEAIHFECSYPATGTLALGTKERRRSIGDAVPQRAQPETWLGARSRTVRRADDVKQESAT
jgi:hypothetical protein